jgi:hypothetical protein
LEPNFLEVFAMVEYKLIEGFDRYRVGNDGSVWSRRKDSELWRQMKTRIRKGVVCVILAENGKYKQHKVASLVLCAFVGKPEGDIFKPIYKDGNKQNCTLANLSWGQRQRKPKGAIDAEMAYDLEYLGDRGINKCLQLYWVGGVDKIAIANDLEVEFRTVQHILDTNERVYGHKIYT